MPMAALSFVGLEKRFEAGPVFRGLDGAVAAGQLLVVTGPNGSGKTTLLRCLAGLLRPSAGEILHTEEGRTLAIAERRRRVGWVAPDLSFYPELTVEENLRLSTRLRRLDPRPAGELARRLGLPLERRVAALSSGMRQRLRWCWATLHRPALLLLDEPFQNLDPAGEAATRDLLSAHRQGGGVTVVAVPAAIELDDVDARLELAG